MTQTINIGGASGYWGESAMATPQFLAHKEAGGALDYLVYDYLAEITMSILARAKAKDPSKGYATDFVDYVIRPFADRIASSGVKLLANAGGVNPEACGAAVREIIKEKGLDLTVAVITGDDLLGNKDKIAAEGLRDMFDGRDFPDVDKILSINAYLGAFPVAKALAAGADIVITGRCVDSAVTLGALIHEFGWEATDWDLLASGSLCGHILECGPQVTGGNFTDWEDAGDIAEIGYPIAEVAADGSFVTTKPDGTQGIVNVGTVSEQMLYEIGDPQAYFLPDVICDFSEVTIIQQAPNRVQVSPAKGRPAPATYKTCLTYADGFRAGTYVTHYGGNATAKAQKFGKAALDRANKALRVFNLGEYTEFSQEIMGAGSQFGEARESDEVVMKLAVKHPDMRACAIFLKEVSGLALATPPGLSGFTGVRAKPSPVVRLFSYLTPKGELPVKIDVGGNVITHTDALFSPTPAPIPHTLPKPPQDADTDVPLIKLAWARSGDKGNKSNIGIIARQPEYLPYLVAALTPDIVEGALSHFMETSGAVEVFHLPGSHSINFLIDNVLGGGGPASLRNDSQGKGYGQILLRQMIKVPSHIASQI
ncbi:acyclic terpene utilization AtuA family protein [Litorimonas sp. RW-G-Af-16]|uniref:acyclic terpene utilization AtuA family protein n=1 Tax=Litorimonas sp. RW-G-Af-16 TaxID=3241168 RepID=UPI003AAEFCD8